MKNLLVISLLLVCGPTLADHHAEQELPIVSNFKAADGDASSTLNMSEFKNFVKANAKADIGRFAMIEKRSMENRVFSRMDSNDDGEIALQELMAMRK
jgi:Ca2+-binding EF-hand superfamily protein